MVLAVLAAVVSLITVAIIEGTKTRRVSIVEKQETLRAELPYRVEHTLAQAEARYRERHAKAKTRRFFRLPSDETHKPDAPTNLQQVMDTTNRRLLEGGTAFAQESDTVIDRQPYNGFKASDVDSTGRNVDEKLQVCRVEGNGTVSPAVHRGRGLSCRTK
jgi:hypothetical protein